jgi:hypothetical protein
LQCASHSQKRSEYDDSIIWLTEFVGSRQSLGNRRVGADSHFGFAWLLMARDTFFYLGRQLLGG